MYGAPPERFPTLTGASMANGNLADEMRALVDAKLAKDREAVVTKYRMDLRVAAATGVRHLDFEVDRVSEDDQSFLRGEGFHVAVVWLVETKRNVVRVTW